jgi:hypothetical protein
MVEISLRGSGQHGDEAQLRDRAEGGDGGAAEAVAITAVGACDTFDRTDAAPLTGQGWGREVGQKADQVSAAYAVDVDFGTLQSAQKVLLIIEDANAFSVKKRDIPAACPSLPPGLNRTAPMQPALVAFNQCLRHGSDRRSARLDHTSTSLVPAMPD